jgi:hypothetical protein
MELYDIDIVRLEQTGNGAINTVRLFLSFAKDLRTALSGIHYGFRGRGGIRYEFRILWNW